MRNDQRYFLYDAVKNALEKEKWIITDDPLFIRCFGVKFYINLVAEKINTECFMNSHEVSQKGIRSVEAELLKRGAALVTSCGTRKSLLYATDSSRTVELRIKTKRKGNWHTTIDEAEPVIRPPDSDEVKNFWVFVDIRRRTEVLDRA